MKAKGFLIALCALVALAVPVASKGEKILSYEPAVVELAGTVHQAQSRHPNRTIMKYSILKLDEAITVGGDGDSPINSREENITEVQLMSGKDGIRKKLLTYKNRQIRVRGTLFQGHTAWHMRAIMMDVSEILE